MLEFTRNKFRAFIEVYLWLTLIAFAIFGCTTGYGMKYSGSIPYAFLGLIIGIVLGMIFNILQGGMLAVFLNMDDNIEEINDNLKKLLDNGQERQHNNDGSQKVEAYQKIEAPKLDLL